MILHSFYIQGRAKSGTSQTRFFSSVWSRSGLWSRFLATVWWRWRVFPKIFSKRFLLTFRSGKFWWRSRFFCSWRFALLTQVRIDFFFDWNLVSTKDFEDSLWIVCSNPQTAFSRVTEFCKNICLLNIEVNCKTFENSTWKNLKTAAEKELPSNVGASLINRSISCYLRFKLTWKLFEERNNLESVSSAKMKKLNYILYRFCFRT